MRKAMSNLALANVVAIKETFNPHAAIMKTYRELAQEDVRIAAVFLDKVSDMPVTDSVAVSMARDLARLQEFRPQEDVNRTLDDLRRYITP